MLTNMNRFNKIILSILLLGLLTGVISLFFGILGPLYRTEVVKIPINIESPSIHKINFTVDRSEKYLIEIHMKSIFSEEKMDFILGDFVSGSGGALNISWELNTKNSFLTKGSNSEYGYSPIFGKNHSGLTIGRIDAKKYNNYQLTIKTHNNSENWNQAEPYIEVGLHPADLEGYLVLQILGALFIVIFSISLFIYAPIYKIKKAHLTRRSS